MENRDEHCRELHERGIVKLEGLVSVEEAGVAREMIFDLAKEHEVFSGRRWMKSASRFGYPKPFRDALNRLNRTDRFPRPVGDRLVPLVEKLFGQPVTPLSPGQQILFSLPVDENWAVPSDAWHIDLPKMGEQASPGLQAFTFLEDAQPKGGAPLVIAGSHRLFNNSPGLSSRELKRKMRDEPYFQSLFDPGRPAIVHPETATGCVHDVELEVVELSGKVGDLYLMDLRVLHTPAQNGSDKARMMLTGRFPRSTIAEGFGGESIADAR
ncbi:MAG: phytanoyl-CoA dioxygenase family protein [Pseudomonadota bacterium]